MRYTWLSSLLFLILLSDELYKSATESFRIQNEKDVVDYLLHFGYLDEGTEGRLTPEDVKEALEEFQETTHDRPDGVLHRKTLRLMNAPRCGNRDERLEEGDEIDGSDVNTLDRGASHLRPPRRGGRRRRSIPLGKKWQNTTLRYRIEKFPSRERGKLDPRTVQNEFDHAFKYWEDVTNFKFKKVTNGKADIRIKFLRGSHGDGESFDGPGQTLAHAFYPEHGVIHFDNEEKWSVGFTKGHYDLRTVAVHEIGHVLGLPHLENSKAVMYKLYEGHRRRSHDDFALHPQDIAAVEAIYGPKRGRKGDGTESPRERLRKQHANNASSEGTKTRPPDLCVDPRIDAITTMADGRIYIFKGAYYFRLETLTQKLRDSNRHLINATFQGLPSDLDAAIKMSNNKTYFFKGSQYWRASFIEIDPNYPKYIRENFKGIPNDIDAATMWSWNNEPYFFKRDKYWKYDEQRAHLVTSRPMGKNWPGIPASLDAAFRAPDDRTYFIKGGKYWMFHDEFSEVEASSYPKSTKSWLFKCPNNDVRRKRKLRHQKHNQQFQKRKTI